MRGFGVALVERAAMDAACRAAGVSFFRALKDDLFGFDPGRVHAGLADWSLAKSLPDAPLESVRLRHTVGLADPLRAADVVTRVDDGLPESLEEDVRAHGLTTFKVKLGGDPDEDRALEEDLLVDPKERAEHVMLVDLARNDLGRVCEFGSVAVDELMVIERYSHVMHIVSGVSGKLRPGTGAVEALLSRRLRSEMERAVGEVTKIETATEPRFQELFVAAMAMPHVISPAV